MERLPLLLTNTQDVHVDALVNEFRARGRECFRFNTDLLGTNATISWTHQGFRIEEFGRQISAAQVSAVLWRRPEPPIQLMKALTEDTRQFAADEALLTIFGVLRASCPPDVLWVSHPDRMRAANFRPVQLLAARRMGFLIPESLITNSPSAARAFIDKHEGRCAAKNVGQGPLRPPPGKTLYTVNLARRAASLTPEVVETVAYAPVLFQQYIEKAFELRVTCFGRRCITVRINSQEEPECVDDWRRFALLDDHTAERIHRPFQLPPTVGDKCLALLEEWGLNFGCFDLVVTPDGDFVFLEVNVNGQFLWLDEAVPGTGLLHAWADLILGDSVPITI